MAAEDSGRDRNDSPLLPSWTKETAKLVQEMLPGEVYRIDPPTALPVCGIAASHHEKDEEHEEDPHDHGDAIHREHSGIHQHGIDAYHARFIVEASLPGGARLIVNLIFLLPDHGDAATSYPLGFGD